MTRFELMEMFHEMEAMTEERLEFYDCILAERDFVGWYV